MINITNILRNTEGFNPVDFIEHLRTDALIAAGCKKTAQGWWDKRGAYLGIDDEVAIRRSGITYQQVKPTSFYALDDTDDPTQLDGGVVGEVYGVVIWGVSDV